MLVMQEGGFMGMGAESASFDTLRAIARECTVRWGVAAFFNFIGDFEQYTAVGYMPEERPEGHADRPVEMAIDLCGLRTPRKVSMCQFVINAEKPILMDGIKDHPAPAAQEDLMAASKTDPVLADFLGKLQSNVNVFQNTPNDEKTKEIAEDFLMRCTANPEGCVKLRACASDRSFNSLTRLASGTFTPAHHSPWMAQPSARSA